MATVVAPRTRLVGAFCIVMAAGGLVGRAAADEAGAVAPAAPSPWPDRLGPSASVAMGAGYSFFEGETGGVSVLGLVDLGWFVTDRFALLVGATLVNRPGEDEDIHDTLWRLGVEYRLDPRHYLRLSGGRSVLRREKDELEGDSGFDTIGTGEGALLVAGVPAALWRWGELSFQVDIGGALNHGDATESTYVAFVATCLELAVR